MSNKVANYVCLSLAFIGFSSLFVIDQSWQYGTIGLYLVPLAVLIKVLHMIVSKTNFKHILFPLMLWSMTTIVIACYYFSLYGNFIDDLSEIFSWIYLIGAMVLFSIAITLVQLFKVLKK